MKNIHKLCLVVCIGCQGTTSTSTLESTTPQCLVHGAQQEYWERLGSVLSFSEGTPVAPSLLVVNDELWLYYSLREGKALPGHVSNQQGEFRTVDNRISES